MTNEQRAREMFTRIYESMPIEKLEAYLLHHLDAVRVKGLRDGLERAKLEAQKNHERPTET